MIENGTDPRITNLLLEKIDRLEKENDELKKQNKYSNESLNRQYEYYKLLYNDFEKYKIDTVNKGLTS